MKYVLNFLKKHQQKIYIIIIILFIVMNIVLFILNYQFSKELKKTEVQCLNNQDAFKIELAPNDNFVFLGDSITNQYPLKELFENLPVVNSGIGGVVSENVLTDLEETVYIYNPSKVFLLVGINDIRENISSEEIVNNIEKITKEIRSNRPNTTIYVESIYPINNTDNEKIDHELLKDANNKKIKETNKLIKDYCETSDIEYINIYDSLVDENGNLDLKYTQEGLHITDSGYLKITKILYKYLQEK